MVEKSARLSLFERFVPMLLLISVALAFMVGVLWQKVSNLEKGGSTAGTTAGVQNAAPTAIVDLATIKGLWDKDIIKFGKNDSKVLFVEVADPSCPYCHVANGKNPELAKQIGATFQYQEDGGSYVPPVTEMRKLVNEGKASYAFIYFPGHGNGELGTKALYCANDMGRYWEAHDLIYSNKGYDFLNETVLNDKAKSGEMAEFLKTAADPGKMKECLDSGKYDARLTSDQDLATTLGVSGTPGFYVNSSRFDGAYSWTDMKPAVDEALK